MQKVSVLAACSKPILHGQSLLLACGDLHNTLVVSGICETKMLKTGNTWPMVGLVLISLDHAPVHFGCFCASEWIVWTWRWCKSGKKKLPSWRCPVPSLPLTHLTRCVDHIWFASHAAFGWWWARRAFMIFINQRPSAETAMKSMFSAAAWKQLLHFGTLVQPATAFSKQNFPGCEVPSDAKDPFRGQTQEGP